MSNKELILTIIEIQGFLSRYGKTHTNWHEALNETIDKLSQVDKLDLIEKKYAEPQESEVAE